MARDVTAPRTGLLGSLRPTHLGLAGQVATSWGVAGGLAGSVAVTAHVLAGQLSSSLGFLTTTLFFVVGSMIGYLHGGILGYLGRPEGVSRGQALRRLALAALYAVPVMVAGWVIAMVLAMSAASLLAGRTVALLTSLVGWVAALGVLVWAVIETRTAVGHLCRRWPGARVLLVTLGLAFLALLPVFVVSRPQVWIVGVEPSATAAGFMAVGATIWIVGPAGALVLLAVRARSKTRSHSSSETEVPDGVA
ncbi:MAG: hypothetical protein R6U63_07180 [Longimicrobiales bacterium]